jgi:hypothetical protein
MVCIGEIPYATEALFIAALADSAGDGRPAQDERDCRTQKDVVYVHFPSLFSMLSGFQVLRAFSAST